MGNGNFRCHTESAALDRSPKKLLPVITLATPYSCAKLGAYPFTGSCWTHACSITKIIFIYAFFRKVTYTWDCRRIFTHNGMQTRARMCIFCFFTHSSSFRGSKSRELQILGINRRLRGKIAKSKNVYIIKTTASISTKFAQWHRPPNALRGWSQHTHHKSKMADSRHLEKNRKIAIFRPRFERFRRDLAR